VLGRNVRFFFLAKGGVKAKGTHSLNAKRSPNSNLLPMQVTSLPMIAASSASTLTSENVLLALKVEGNPETLAANLLQTSVSDKSKADASCAKKTGYEHCADCAMPAIKTLVNELVKVKDTVWQAQKDMAANANTVCDKDAPANRAGGAAKCCSASATTSAYQAAGYAMCSAGSTFSPADDAAVADVENVKYSNLKGFYYDSKTRPSSMVADCCHTGSTCHINDAVLQDSMDTTRRMLSTLMVDKEAKQQKIDSITIEVQLETTKIQDHRCVPHRCSEGLTRHRRPRRACSCVLSTDCSFLPAGPRFSRSANWLRTLALALISSIWQTPSRTARPEATCTGRPTRRMPPPSASAARSSASPQQRKCAS